MTTLDAGMVTRLAELASLALEEEEIAELTHDLSRIVEYVAILDQAETLDRVLAPIETPVDQAPGARGWTESSLRADEPSPSLSNELALREAPRAVDGGFAVPGFVDEG
jgi:aspartyl-tRNA(Asn)/glutamyl-tRNA(Gln) amidotransferase subunit C